MNQVRCPATHVTRGRSAEAVLVHCSKNQGHEGKHYSMSHDEHWTESVNPLQVYQCHKRVLAAKIKSVPHPLQGVLVLEGPDGTDLRVWVTDAFWARNKPEPGGYFVQYEDGYQSYSPMKAFEEGYTRFPVPAPSREELLAAASEVMKE